MFGETNSPGVKLVNDALEANDSEKPRAKTGQPRQEQDGERQQGLPPGRLRQAAGQTSASCTGVAASFRDRRAAAAVPRVRRSGVQWGFVFVIGNRVMLRHIPRRSRRGKQAKRAIWYHTVKNSPPSSFSLPRSTSETTCTTFPTRPAFPKTPTVIPNFSTLLPTDHKTSKIIPGNHIATRFCCILEMLEVTH